MRKDLNLEIHDLTNASGKYNLPVSIHPSTCLPISPIVMILIVLFFYVVAVSIFLCSNIFIHLISIQHCCLLIINYLYDVPVPFVMANFITSAGKKIISIQIVFCNCGLVYSKLLLFYHLYSLLIYQFPLSLFYTNFPACCCLIVCDVFPIWL